MYLIEELCCVCFPKKNGVLGFVAIFAEPRCRCWAAGGDGSQLLQLSRADMGVQELTRKNVYKTK